MNPSTQFLSFDVAGTRYGIGIESLQEVVNMVALTPVPDWGERPGRRNAVAGLMNLRGRVLPVLSLRAALALEEIPPTRSTRIIIVRGRSEPVGWIVDAVQGVFQAEPDRLAEVEPRGDAAADILTRVYRQGDSLVLILDVPKLLERLDVAGIALPSIGQVRS